MTITITAQDRDYIRRAKSKGLRLYEDGSVTLYGDGYAAVRDGRHVYYADSEGCDCSPAARRNGHACEHMWAGRHALDSIGTMRATQQVAA